MPRQMICFWPHGQMHFLAYTERGKPHGASEALWRVRNRIVRFRLGQPVWIDDDLFEELKLEPNWIEVGRVPLFEDVNRAVILRRGALGDLIQLRAVLASLLEESDRRPLVRLICSGKGASIFKRDTVFDEVITSDNDGDWPFLNEKTRGCLERVPGDATYWFDGVVEIDHSGVAGDAVHRTELFWRQARMASRKNRPAKKATRKKTTKADLKKSGMPGWDRLRFEIPHWGTEEQAALNALRTVAKQPDFRPDLPTIGLQVRGSGPMKTLAGSTIRALAASLAKKNNVILIEPDPNKSWRDTRVFPQPRHGEPPKVLDAAEAKAMMSHLDAVVCNDSGVLWLASAATSGPPVFHLDVIVRDRSTGAITGMRKQDVPSGVYAHRRMVPLVVILGPTGPEQRIAHHDLYSAGGAVPVRVNYPPFVKDVCPSCSEHAKACEWTWACMAMADPGILAVEVQKALSCAVAAGRARDKAQGVKSQWRGGRAFWERLGEAVPEIERAPRVEV